MEPKNQTDHIALLSLMIVGVLTKRLIEVNQLDTETKEQSSTFVAYLAAKQPPSGR